MAESGQDGSKQLSVEEFERLFPDNPVDLFRVACGPMGAREFKWHAAWSAREFDPHDGRLIDPTLVAESFSGDTPGEALYGLAVARIEKTRKRLSEALDRVEKAKAQERELVRELAALEAAFEREVDNG